MNKHKLANVATMVVEYLTKQERYGWSSITPGGFYEPARPAEEKEVERISKSDGFC